MNATSASRLIVPVAAITVALFSVASGVRAAPAQRDPGAFRRPNVVLIITDDQGYGDLSCHGNSILQTPHVDELWRQSIRLTNFHVDPTCSPTRAALMTGRYSTRTGVWHTVMGRHMPRRDELMMPRVFAEAGYRTAIFGKWHLGDNYPFRPQDRGFQEVLTHGGGGVGQIPDYWGNDYFDDTYFHNGRPQKFDGYCTDVFFGEATKFITTNRQRPFFVYLSTNAPHSPYRVADKYSRPYQDKVGDDVDLAKLYGMIANIDENVGRLLKHLDTLGLTDNTVVIFMTDNGTARGATFTDYRGNEGKRVSGYNAGMRGRKGSPYEGGHRVPCFLRWPSGGLKDGRDVAQLTAHLDLLPTLIDLCQLRRPVDRPFDGLSLVRLLSGREKNWPKRTLFAHHQELPRPEKGRFGCVMRGPWRLILRNDLPSGPRLKLYDIAADPGQKSNVRDRHATVTKELHDAYEEWWRGTAQGFDEYSEILVGHPRQNPTRLTCFEWHSSRHWWQRSVRNGSVENGFWAIKVARGGTYEITLRRWPKETGAAISTALDGGKAILAVKARIRIGEIEDTQPIAAGASAVKFKVRLQPGATRLQTWLIDPDDKSCGAYYATLERVD